MLKEALRHKAPIVSEDIHGDFHQLSKHKKSKYFVKYFDEACTLWKSFDVESHIDDIFEYISNSNGKKMSSEFIDSILNFEIPFDYFIKLLTPIKEKVGNHSVDLLKKIITSFINITMNGLLVNGNMNSINNNLKEEVLRLSEDELRLAVSRL